MRPYKYVASYAICFWQAINALPALEELDVSNNKVSKIPDLGRCKKVRS